MNNKYEQRLGTERMLPLALILPRFLGVAGVYAAEAVSDAVAALCCTAIFALQFPKILRGMKPAPPESRG